MKALQKKIREVEDEHAEETLIRHLDRHDQEKTERALKLIGGIYAVDTVAKNLSSQTIMALVRFQEEKLYQQFGFDRFVDFLNESDHSPMSKSEFYERKKVFDAEGAAIYDAFNEARIPISTRKLLANHGEEEIAIEGDEIVIGDERADLSDLPTIKLLISNFANDNKKLLDEKKRQDEKIEKLADKIETGQAEYDELRRSVDADKNADPYDSLYTKILIDLSNLADLAKAAEISDSRREADLRSLTGQMFRYRDALRPNFTILDETSASELSPDVREVLSATDDWGDELEQ